MTPQERAAELRRLRQRVQAYELRADIKERGDLLGEIVPLLNFNDIYYVNAAQFADLLGQPGFSSGYYEKLEARLNVIMGQAITELEKNLTPAASAPSVPALVPTPKLTDEHGVLWFWHHCSWKVRWWLVAKIIVAAAVLLGVGFALGRINFFVKVWDLWHNR